jgi:hypothetical protein
MDEGEGRCGQVKPKVPMPPGVEAVTGWFQAPRAPRLARRLGGSAGGGLRATDRLRHRCCGTRLLAINAIIAMRTGMGRDCHDAFRGLCESISAHPVPIRCAHPFN